MLQTPWMDYLREFNLLSVFIRLALSVLLSGLVGFERELKGQPAGLRTHMLVCLGSTLAMLTNLFVVQSFGLADPTRIAAQVISGIGFLGAGAIVVSGRLQRQVKGLTTAAGLWASACMGIALGAGFYEGALLAFGLVMVIISLLHNINERIHGGKRILQLYVEFVDIRGVKAFIKTVRGLGCNIESAEMSTGAAEGATAFYILRYPSKSITESELLSQLLDIEGVLLIEVI